MRNRSPSDRWSGFVSGFVSFSRIVRPSSGPDVQYRLLGVCAREWTRHVVSFEGLCCLCSLQMRADRRRAWPQTESLVAQRVAHLPAGGAGVRAAPRCGRLGAAPPSLCGRAAAAPSPGTTHRRGGRSGGGEMAARSARAAPGVRLDRASVAGSASHPKSQEQRLSLHGRSAKSRREKSVARVVAVFARALCGLASMSVSVWIRWALFRMRRFLGSPRCTDMRPSLRLSRNMLR